MLKYMLDTNICIYTMKNRPAEVGVLFAKNIGRLCISTVTLMELVYGAEKSTNPERNLAAIDNFVGRLDILNYDQAAATHTGQVRAELARIGKPIGYCDTMIAAHARSSGLIIVTNNGREFERVPGLRIENWVSQE